MWFKGRTFRESAVGCFMGFWILLNLSEISHMWQQLGVMTDCTDFQKQDLVLLFCKEARWPQRMSLPAILRV